MTALLIWLCFVCGLVLVWSALRKESLANRIADYVGGSRTHDPVEHIISRLSTFGLSRLIHRPQSLWGSDEVIARALRQSWSAGSVGAFRRRQLLYAVGTDAGIALWVMLRHFNDRSAPTIEIFLFVTGFIGAGWFAKWQLRQAAAKRMAAINLELPAVVDLLAFAVSAGEPLLLAFRRLVATCAGETVREIQQLVHVTNSGIPLNVALEQLDRDLEHDLMGRLLWALVVAIERGTPMAQLLRAQAEDARNASARELLIAAGKKETTMMLPVVFLILPTIVAVALYPGLVAMKFM